MDLKYSTFSRKQVFRSRKGWTAGLCIWGTVAVLLVAAVIPVIQSGLNNGAWILAALLAILIFFLSWIWFGTYYVLTPYYLTYRSGPFRGNIPIPAIEWVEHQHIVYSGMRAALAYNGLLIHYNKYDTIYVSPTNKAAFIYSLQKFNPNVKVKLENES